MSIRVVCPNGHELKVRDEYAGKAGLCPKCRARVDVPARTADDVLEDSALGLLGPHVPRVTPSRGTAAAQAELSALSSLSSLSSISGIGRSGISGGSGIGSSIGRATPKKECSKCHQEISAGTHICPYCHTYIANLADFH